MNMAKYFMWILYERLHNHNKAKHNKTVCIFLGIYCSFIETYESVGCTSVQFPCTFLDDQTNKDLLVLDKGE